MADTKKKIRFKGLDLRTNKLYRMDGTASDLANVRMDNSGNLVKREDYVQNIVPRGVSGETGFFLDKLPFNTKIIGMVEDYSEDYVILVCYDASILPDGANFLYKYFSGNTVEKIESQALTGFASDLSPNPSYVDVRPPLVKNISYKITEKILYYTGESEDGSLTYIYKYDGENWHVSGVSNIGKGTDISGDIFFRAVPFTIDAQARFTFGDYSQGKIGSSIGDSVVLSPETDLTTGDLKRDVIRSVAGCEIDETKTIVWNGSVSDRTISINSSTLSGVEKGQHLLYPILNISLPEDPANIGFTYARFLIEEVDRNLVTITIGELQAYDGVRWIDASNDVPLSLSLSSGARISSKLMLTYTSDLETSGFQIRDCRAVLVPRTSIDNFVAIPLAAPYTFLDYAGPVGEFFEDFYAEEFVKGVPPKTNGSIAIYRNTLITHDEEFIYLSDNYSGGNQEDFTPSDAYRIGTSDKGPITAVFANETYVVVLRKFEAYYLSGNIITGNFRDLAYNSTRIGCASAAGVIDVAGVCYFPSVRSIHAALPSGSMKEIGDVVEPLFLDDVLGYAPNMEDSVSKLDFKREYVYTYIPTKDSVTGQDIIMAYSLYNQEWFLYTDIDASGGLYVTDGKVHYSDGIDIFVESDSRQNAVNGFYRSNFETLQLESLKKKFTETKLHTIGMDAATIGFNLYADYNTEDPIMEDREKEIEENDIFCIKRFPAGKYYSAAIEIVSSGTDDLLINGYEYSYKAVQSEYDDKQARN